MLTSDALILNMLANYGVTSPDFNQFVLFSDPRLGDMSYPELRGTRSITTLPQIAPAPTLRLQEQYSNVVNVSTFDASFANVSWPRFREWLNNQYSRPHAKAIFNFALKYHEAAFDTAKAAQLKTMTLNKQHYVMEALSAFSKFEGKYDRWLEVKKASGLKWTMKNPLQVIQGILSEESNDAIDWLKSSLPKIPKEYRVPLIFAALTGLRIGEACKSCKLIFDLKRESRLADYYNDQMGILQHFKYPKLFLRRTKNAYISFVFKELVELAASSQPKTYVSINSLLKRLGIPIQIRQLRKFYATNLRKYVEREFVDILQGRVDASVFTQHYYRPQMLELKKKTLQAIKPLERDLLSLV